MSTWFGFLMLVMGDNTVYLVPRGTLTNQDNPIVAVWI